MLDVAFARLVGAGLLSFAPAIGYEVPRGAFQSGERAIVFLHGLDRDRTQALIAAAVAALWDDWRDSGMPVSVAEKHLTALPGILDRHRVDRDLVVKVLAIIRVAEKSGRGGHDQQARAIAADLVDRAGKSGTLSTAGLTPTIATFFLERLFEQLLKHRRFIDRHQVDIEQYLRSELCARALDNDDGARKSAIAEPREASTTDEASGSESSARATVAEGGVAAAQVRAGVGGAETKSAGAEIESAAQTADETGPAIEPGEPQAVGPADTEGEAEANGGAPEARPPEYLHLGASGEMPSALKVSLLQLIGRRPNLTAPIDVLIEVADAIACELFAEIERARSQPSPAVGKIDECAQCLRRGDLNGADAALAVAEERSTRLAGSSDRELPPGLAGQVRAIRGLLQELQLDCRRAARHYVLAARNVPRSDFEERWRLMSMQARALQMLAETQADVEAVEEAARVCAEALAVLPEPELPRAHAEAHAMLGQLMVLAGNMRNQLGRYGQALPHFRAALEGFQALELHGRARDTQIELADAIRLAGEARGEVALLEEAARLFKELAGGVYGQISEEERARVMVSQASVLARIGHLTLDRELLKPAVDQLRWRTASDEDTPDSIDWQGADIALAQALLATYALEDDASVLAEAEGLLRRWLRPGTPEVGSDRRQATIYNELGSVIWARALAPGGSAKQLAEARQLKENASRLFAECDAEQAQLAREDAEAIGLEIASRPQRGAA